VTGTLNVLEAARQAATKCLVLSSTAAVYGAPAESPLTEATPVAPINPYGESKLAAEMAAKSFARAYGFSVAALRYFNVAGAVGAVGEDHRPETHLIPSAIDAALGLREELTIFGTDFPTPDGTAIRDYVHVGDLVDAHLLVLDQLVAGSGTLDASVREVIAAVERVTGKRVPVSFADRRPGDPPALVAESSRARQVLGWEARRSTLDEMIATTLEWRRRFPTGYAG
jgi:UDP-glucose-4-epimerase GalE